MATGSYYSKSKTKDLIPIAQNDTNDDSTLDQAGADGNRQVDDLMAPYAVALPLTGDELETAENIANAHAVAIYKLKRLDHNAHNAWIKIRDAYTAALIKKLQATPITTTVTSAYAQDYRTAPLSDSK